MIHIGSEKSRPVLLTGGTGFIGRRLLTRLVQAGHRVRCLVRSEDRFRSRFPDLDGVETIQGDIRDPDAVEKSMQRVEAAYYLVHSMGGGPVRAQSFARDDKRAARSFVAAAEKAGVERIIYLGGLGDRGQNLSRHLSSRHEVGEILGSGRPELTMLRAAVIIGAGGASYEIIRTLVERLPVIVGPRWLNTLCQPIAADNVVDFLLGCLEARETAGEHYDICGPDQVTYRQLMFAYAKARGLIRFIIALPLSSTRLPAYGVDLVTFQPHGLVKPLLEGMRNQVLCQENSLDHIVPARLLSLREAMERAIAEEPAAKETQWVVVTD